MRNTFRVAAAAALAIPLMGIVMPPPPDTTPPPPTGPTCYGLNRSYNSGNLVNPAMVYEVDSCNAAVLVAARNVAGNYAMYVGIVVSHVPSLLPASVYAMAWNTSNIILAQCAAPGRGVVLMQSGFNGMVTQCSPQ